MSELEEITRQYEAQVQGLQRTTRESEVLATPAEQAQRDATAAAAARATKQHKEEAAKLAAVKRLHKSALEEAASAVSTDANLQLAEIRELKRGLKGEKRENARVQDAFFEMDARLAVATERLAALEPLAAAQGRTVIAMRKQNASAEAKLSSVQAQLASRPRCQLTSCALCARPPASCSPGAQMVKADDAH